MADTSSTPPILRGISSALSPSLLSAILSSRILLVGSGGIGCELLKNLALSGFRNVEIIDLDTIDVSNLNRQFLFRARHVGMPKCVVASEAALGMVPPLDGTTANYTPHHGNVCDNSQFNVPYLQRFNLVLNALDNITARRRVNRLCLASSIPLIEAGTAGYLGQVTVIDKPSGTECYECQAKATQKVYPICTIRSTPSAPVHCIVWGKELYKLCFGGKVEESMLFEDEESLRADRESGEEGESGKTDNEKSTASGKYIDGGDVTTTTTTGGGGGEKSTYMDQINNLRSLLRVNTDVPQSTDNNATDETNLRSAAEQALTALFVTEINKQIGMDRYKTADKVPSPLSSDDLQKCTDESITPPTERADYKPTQIWTPADCLSELTACFIQAAGSSMPPLAEFDKDDEMAMRFVTAASNLRSYVFQIDPIQSLYSAKGIAGNIIPAIATTNAIVAGLQVLQAFHILKCQMEKKNGDLSEEEATKMIKKVCRYTYCLRDKTRKGYYLQPTTLPDPNPNCFVCRNAIISLTMNTHEWTLDMLISRVIKKELGFSEPTILVGGDIVYEEGEDIDPSEYAPNLSKKLVNLPAGGVAHGSVIRIEDFTQDLEVEASVSHKEEWFIVDEETKESKVDDREEGAKFEIGGKKPTVAAAPVAAGGGEINDEAAAEEKKDSGADDDDDIELLDAPADGKNNNAKTPAASTDGDQTAGGDDGSDIEVVEIPGSPARMPLKKRPLELDTENGGAKKAKVDDSGANGNGEVEVIELDSD